MLQRATLAEKEVTTLKEQLATTSPTPLQANIPKTTNGNTHLVLTRDQDLYNDLRPEIIENDRDLSPDFKRKFDEDLVIKTEMAATARSNSNSCRSSPVVGNNQGAVENELATKEKEVSELSI